MQSIPLSLQISVLTLECTWRTEPKRALATEVSRSKSTKQRVSKQLPPELTLLLSLVHSYQHRTLIFDRRKKKTTNTNAGFCLTSGSCQNSICIHASHQTKAGRSATQPRLSAPGFQRKPQDWSWRQCCQGCDAEQHVFKDIFVSLTRSQSE